LAFFKKNQNTEKTEGTGSILEYLHDVVYILALILVLFTFCMRVVIVSGSSMFSTLVDGDYLLLINRPLCGELE
jgi:signal peptidase I